ncbi:MAG: helix-turn-helix domain-containing protein [Lentisphaerota bacterium]
MQPMNELIKLIKAFERRCGLKICLHDYSGKVINYFPQIEFRRHDNEYCHCVKEQCGLNKCLAFEMRKVQITLTGHPDGFFKICHGGVIEYATPITKGPNILGVMFVGIFRLKSPIVIPDAIVCRCGGNDFAPLLNNKFYKKIQCLEKGDFKDIEEIAKSLKLRIETLLDREEEIFLSHEDKIKWEIEKYIGQNCQKDVNIHHLAKNIFLSASRTGHLVKELFNMTYPELLNKNRINNAKILLASTALSISETAYRCGFSNPAYFYRIFRKIEKTTPGNFKNKNNKIKNMLNIPRSP